MPRLLATFFLFALSSGPVLADGPSDFIKGQADCCKPHIWDGAYVGAFAGYQDGQDELTSDEFDPFDDEPFSPVAFDIEGFTGGVYVGANLQHGNVVLGLEGEIGSGESGKRIFGEEPFSDADRIETEINAIARARVRAGYAFGHVLPFIAAGVSLADTTIKIHDRFPADDEPDVLNEDLYRVGFNAGGGVDVLFGHGLFGRVEYLYDRFGSTGFGVPNIADSAHFALDVHTVRAGLAYQFGGEPRDPLSVKDAPVSRSPAIWSGAYIGAFAGYQQAEDGWRSDETDPADDSRVAPIALDSDGFTGGAILGVSIQRGAIVAGIEGDIGSGSGSERLDFSERPSADIDAIETEINSIAHARVRVGYAFGNVLPFIAAGVSLADTTVTIRDEFARPEIKSDDVYRVGFTAGAGVDVLFGSNFFGRAEYLYDRFGTTGFGSDQQNDSEYFDLEVHTVRGALAYKFGGDGRYEAASIKDGPVCCGPALWSGGYIGGFAGYQEARDDWTSDETSPADDERVAPIEIDSDGFTGGGYIGASIQHGSVVLGVEGDIGSGNSERRNLTNLGVGFNPESVESEINWTAHARVRAGYAFGNVMPFIAAGVALADTTVTLFDEDQELKAERDDLYRVGFSIGGGVDYQFGSNLVGRVEYLYDQYTGANYGSTEQDSEFFELKNETVRAGLAVKFD